MVERFAAWRRAKALGSGAFARFAFPWRNGRFSVKKRQISGKTVHFPSCGFSAENGRFPEKRWIFQVVDFP
ncbi:MAG: hypothetical protein J6T65_08425, partial [Clostridia bacterium]|nr:hypothetical protein [Clostridia bacterium]